MENLWEKLKPSLRLIIELDMQLYPSRVGGLYKELNDKCYMSDVIYTHIVTLEDYYFRIYNTIPKNAWECLIDKN